RTGVARRDTELGPESRPRDQGVFCSVSRDAMDAFLSLVGAISRRSSPCEANLEKERFPQFKSTVPHTDTPSAKWCGEPRRSISHAGSTMAPPSVPEKSTVQIDNRHPQVPEQRNLVRRIVLANRK